jgi:uncharacterized protein (TIGR03435 family)
MFGQQWVARSMMALFAAVIGLAQNQPAFEVASVKPSQSNEPPAWNFPLGPGDVYAPNGGYLSAKRLPLFAYILFAYKIMGNQSQYLVRQLPDWTRTERYDIEARAAIDPGKDGMRLMMRSLLAERFRLAMHFEQHDYPVLAFVLAKSGKLGPQLHPHNADTPCPTDPTAAAAAAPVKDKPALCNGLFPLPTSAPGHRRFGGRNVTLEFMGATLSSLTGLDRPLVNQTGLAGSFDFTLDFVPGGHEVQGPADSEVASDISGPTFVQALRDQLGIKLESRKAPLKVPVLDHVERPTAN